MYLPGARELFAQPHPSILRRIYREGFRYQKVGVMFLELVPENNRQLSFMEPSGEERKKQQALMNMLDKANDKYGQRILTLASSGVGRKPWHIRQERQSPGTRCAGLNCRW